jgi:hypothetical protein
MGGGLRFFVNDGRLARYRAHARKLDRWQISLHFKTVEMGEGVLSLLPVCLCSPPCLPLSFLSLPPSPLSLVVSVPALAPSPFLHSSCVWKGYIIDSSQQMRSGESVTCLWYV